MRAINSVEGVLGIFKQNGSDITVSNRYIPEFLEITRIKLSSYVKKVPSRGLSFTWVV